MFFLCANYLLVYSTAYAKDICDGPEIKSNEMIKFVLLEADTLFSFCLQTLKGLSLNSMGEMLFQYTLNGVKRFTALRALDLGDCSIKVSGNTRTCQALRQRIVGLFSSFTNLLRLDLRFSDLKGHLDSVLDALSVPLQYLNISACEVEESDLRNLSKCKHSKSLKEIHLNSLVYRGQIDTPTPILNCLENLVTNIVVAAVQSNNIDESSSEQLCRIISKSSTLKIMDTLYNELNEEALLQLTRSACQCESLSILTINTQPMLAEDQETLVSRREHLQRKVQEILDVHNRDDITMVVVAMGVESVENEIYVDA